MEKMIEFTGGTAAQQMEAATLHAEIRQKKEVLGNALADFCEALKRMRDGKLYQVLGYQDFGAYCEEQHGIRARMAYKYIKAFEDCGRPLMEQHASAGITKLALLGEVCCLDREEFAQEHDLEGMSVQEVKEAVRRAADLGQQVSMLQEENARLAKDAELDRKEREDAHAAAMRYKNECDRRAKDQERLEGLVQQQARQLKERPIEVQPAEPDPEKIQRQVQAALKKAKKEWKQKAEEEKAAAVKEASEKAAEQAAAEANMELAAARTEAENAKAKAEKLEKQLESQAEDAKNGATVEVLFEQLQQVAEQLQQALDYMEGEDKYKADKLRRALARALHTMADQAERSEE